MCEYCENGDEIKWIQDDDTFPVVGMSKLLPLPNYPWELEIASSNKMEYKTIQINYCPFCGRELGN